MPADEIILGASAFTEQPLKRSIKPGEPIRTFRTFEGPQTLADAFEDQIQLDYNCLSVKTQKGLPAVVEIETDESGRADPPEIRIIAEVTWDLDWERTSRDIKGHPYFNSSGVTESTMEKIDLALKKGTATETDWGTVSGFPEMSAYMQCRRRGINNYIVFAPIIRATISMARYAKVLKPAKNAPAIPAHKIIPFAQILLPYSAAEAMTPTSAGIDQPTLHTCIANSSGTYQDIPVDQWLVCPVKRGFQKNPRRYNMVFEWLGAESWTKALYDGGTGYPPS